MAVMARDQWTNRRLDDLNARVESIDRRMETGFGEMREEFRAVRGELQSEFQATRTEIAGIRSDLTHLTYTLIGTMLVGFLGVIATIITQT